MYFSKEKLFVSIDVGRLEEYAFGRSHRCFKLKAYPSGRVVAVVRR